MTVKGMVFNGIAGIGASVWTWCVAAMHNIGEVMQFIGLCFGAGAAVFSFWNAYRTWKRNRKKGSE